MGFIYNLLRRLISTVLFLLLLAVILTLVPNIPPYTNFSTIQLDPYQPPAGQLKIKGSLNQPQELFKGKIHGPESLKVYNEEIYTSIASGEIVKISPGGHLTYVTKVGKPCSSILEEHICGRILGFDIDNTKGLLYAADAYYGIWKIDIKTDKKTLLVSPNTVIDGKKPKFFNSIVLAKNGDLYWTDSSSDYQFKDGTFTIFSDPSARLIHYDAAKKKNTVLIDNLWFANGVALSPDESFIIVAETFRSKVIKYYLSGPKKGQTEDFIKGLPGLPDNIQPTPSGTGVMIALYTATNEDEPRLLHSLAKAPLVRKFIARALTLTKLTFESINKIVNNVIFEDIAFKIGHFSTLPESMTPISGLVYADWSGKVLESYYNTDGTLAHTSDAVVFDGKLYLAAPHHRDFIAVLPAPSEIYKPQVKQPEVTTQKPVVKEQKPQVTTQKPIVKEQKPVVKEQKPVVKEQKPVVKEQKPVVKEQKPVVKEPKPAVKEQKPAVKEQKPVVKEQKPAVKEQKPEVTTQKPVVKEQKPEVTTQKPVVNEQKPIPEKPKTTSKPADTVKVSTTQSPKSTTAEPKPTPKPQGKAGKKDSRQKIPIEETIPSDTAKPSKETLKVIKKDGPAEIPHPQL